MVSGLMTSPCDHDRIFSGLARPSRMALKSFRGFGFSKKLRTSLRLERSIFPSSLVILLQQLDIETERLQLAFDAVRASEGQPKVIGMEGALKSPETVSTDWPKDYPEPFQSELAAFINKADDYQQANPDSDPVVTQRYAHLSSRSLQDAANSASDAIKGATAESQ